MITVDIPTSMGKKRVIVRLRDIFPVGANLPMVPLLMCAAWIGDAHMTRAGHYYSTSDVLSSGSECNNMGRV